MKGYHEGHGVTSNHPARPCTVFRQSSFETLRHGELVPVLLDHGQVLACSFCGMRTNHHRNLVTSAFKVGEILVQGLKLSVAIRAHVAVIRFRRHRYRLGHIEYEDLFSSPRWPREKLNLLS